MWCLKLNFSNGVKVVLCSRLVLDRRSLVRPIRGGLEEGGSRVIHVPPRSASVAHRVPLPCRARDRADNALRVCLIKGLSTSELQTQQTQQSRAATK